MKLDKARKIINKYGAALATEEAILRRESLLPCDKDTIVKAAKLFLAYLIEYDTLNEDTEQSMITSIAGIGSFVPDKEAIEVNKVLHSMRAGEIPSDDPRIAPAMQKVTSKMISLELMSEIQNFILEVRLLDRFDPLYHQRIYTLAGIEYSPEKKRSFWRTLFG